MQMLSTTGWIVHDVGLATAIGGTVFGRAALQPGLQKIRDPQERDLVSDDAWRRFSWVNLAAHVAFAVPWFIGRTMLDGHEVSRRARTLVSIKDYLVIASLVTGVGSIIAGRILGKRGREHLGPAETRVEHGGRPTSAEARKTYAVKRTVGSLGILNLLANVGIAATTVVLSMQANKSLRFVRASRRLP